MLMLQDSLINWWQIQITMLLYSHRLELVSNAFRYEERDGFWSPLQTGPEIYKNGSRKLPFGSRTHLIGIAAGSRCE